MKYKVKLLDYSWCIVLPFISNVLGQFDNLRTEPLSKKPNIPNVHRAVTFDFVPFGDVSDNLYTSRPYSDNKKGIRSGVFSMIFDENYRNKPDDQKIQRHQKAFKRNVSKQYQNNSAKAAQLVRSKLRKIVKESESVKQLSEVLYKLKYLSKLETIDLQIKELKKQSGYLYDFNRNIDKFNNGLLVPSLFNSLHKLDSWRTERRSDFISKFIKNHRANENERAKSINNNNNTIYGDQYKIGSIFIFNHLSENSGSTVSDSNEHRESTSEIFSKLTGEEIKGFPGERLNNLKEEPSGESFIVTKEPSVTAEGGGKGENAGKNSYGDDFSKCFFHRNVTLEQIRLMSKIIDFVERYHGVMNNLNTTENLSSRPGSGVEDAVNYVSLIKNQIEGTKTMREDEYEYEEIKTSENTRRKAINTRGKVEIPSRNERMLWEDGPNIELEDGDWEMKELPRRKG